LLKSLVFLFLLCAPAWARDLPPVLLLLNGTGSAGKSSIGRALEKSLAHATFVSEEKLVFNAYQDILRQRGLRPARPLHDLPELMSYRATLPAALEASLRSEFRRRGQDFIRGDVRRQVELAARQGYDFILLDDTLWKPEQVERWREQARRYRSFHVVVYCPLGGLLEHVRARNLLPEAYEHRDLALPLEMYFSMYVPSFSSRYVDRLEREQLELDLQACGAYQKTLKAREIDWRPYLRVLGNGSEVRIAPFFAYDMMVNTAVSSSQACAAEIRAELVKRAWLNVPVR
jgi:chloramphenicol 3-O-phosphotransferase